jgi:thiol-disulfide isomerase/thioredoxin
LNLKPADAYKLSKYCRVETGGMNKYIAYKASYLFFITLLFCGFAVLLLLSGEAQAGKGSGKLEQLFSDMGVVKAVNALPVDVKLKDLNGRPVSLSDFRGKIVFLNFWTTWCFDCRVEMPYMEKLHQKFKDKNFAMVTINLQESAEQVKQFFKRYQLTFTVLLDSDGETGAHFRITSIPTSFILDRKGIIIGKVVGPRKWDDKRSFALFEHLTNSSVAATSSLRSAK